MPELELRPLVILRDHGGFVSASCAAAPKLVTYADDEEDALDELALFLGEFFGELPAASVAGYLLPESTELREISLLIPRASLARTQRMRTPLALTTLELDADRGRWIRVPAIDHVAFVDAKELERRDEIIRREVLRLAAARELDGFEYLDLLPSQSLTLERPQVLLKPPAHVARAEEKRKAALKLLQGISRPLQASLPPRVERDCSSLVSLLQDRDRPSGVLVGPSGAGKTTLMTQALEAVPALDVFATSGAELVAGQSFLGQLEQRLDRVLGAAAELDAVLYFEELDDLFSGRPGGYEDIASVVQRYLERGRVRLFGELSPERYDRLRQHYPGFFSHLSLVDVEPLSREDAVTALRRRSERERAKGSPALDADAAERLVALVERYDPYHALPGKAVAFAEELASTRIAEPAEDGSLALRTDDVFRGMSIRSGVPEFILRDERSLALAEVERFFQARLVGQSTAIRGVADVICLLKAGLQPAGRPLASFLFVGPTGVGKTELAKALARFLFGSAERLLRFDMSEYADPGSAQRLIRGSEREAGLLTGGIRDQPFSVVLLDEIEKADAAVFDLLLQVLGEGRLSDARGQTTWFSNAIIIMTSNLGATRQRSGMGFGDANTDEQAFYAGVIREHFRPEFVNRLDRIICFEPLGPEQIREVANIALSKLRQRDGFTSRNIELEVSAAALAHLARTGYSPSYGARGLRRHLEQFLVAPAAQLVAAAGSSGEGAQLVVDTTEAAPDAGGAELGRCRRASLTFRLLRRERDHVAADVSSISEVSRLRRRVNGWQNLRPLRSLRDRAAEIVVDLSRASGSKRARRRAPSGPLLGQLSAEHAAIKALLEPLDTACLALEDAEAMMITALCEGTSPELFASEANLSYRRYRGELSRALLDRSRENEIAFVLSALDSGPGLHRVLLPLAEYASRQSWQGLLHIDRAARDPSTGWPALEKRRWGPPLTLEQYLADHGGGPPPGSSLLLRLKGAAVGAWLAFILGRWRLPTDEGFTEVWLRYLRPRFELKDADWDHADLQSAVDTGVGRRSELRFDFTDGPGARIAGNLVPEVTEQNLFERYQDLIVEFVAETVSAGRPFLEPRGQHAD
ncbi:MAG: AAA family ATPase [Polyangiaceae bacterium]